MASSIVVSLMPMFVVVSSGCIRFESLTRTHSVLHTTPPIQFSTLYIVGPVYVFCWLFFPTDSVHAPLMASTIVVALTPMFVVGSGYLRFKSLTKRHNGKLTRLIYVSCIVHRRPCLRHVLALLPYGVNTRASHGVDHRCRLDAHVCRRRQRVLEIRVADKDGEPLRQASRVVAGSGKLRRCACSGDTFVLARDSCRHIADIDLVCRFVNVCFSEEDRRPLG